MFAQLYPGIDGFLGSRASLMFDIVFLAMFAIVPTMFVSIYLVKFVGRYRLHKQIQLTLALILLISVSLFELEQLMVSWEPRAEPSPLFDTTQPWLCPVGISLIVHLVFAVPTPLLWIFVIFQALRKFPSNPVPNDYSAYHRRWARFAAFEMTMTAVTGWVFYVLAFVVS